MNRSGIWFISGLVFLIGILFLLLWVGESEGYTPHDPIHINSDSEFDDTAAAEGWDGEGNATNPYIIEGYSIDVQEYDDCIYIGNTTKYIIIRNCYLLNADRITNSRYETGSGVNLYNVENCLIKNNYFTYNEHGVYIQYSTNNNVENNEIINSFQGITAFHSHHNIIDDNVLSNNTDGLYIAYEHNSIFSNNSIDLSYIGARFYNCTGNKMIYNTIGNNEIGIYLLDFSNENLIMSNTIFSNIEKGLWIQTSRYNIIKYNEIRDNGYGFYMETYINYIFLNNIINNNNQSYIGEYSANIYYNNTKGLGNFWSDYNGNDINSDGIGDTNLPHQGVDNYPLMSQHYPYFPVSSFTISPTTGNISQQFQFNATECWDYEDESNMLMVRWDWENDGGWDTEWSTDKIISYQYLQPGSYIIRLIVKDTDDFTDTITKQLIIINEPPSAFFDISVIRANLSEVLRFNASTCSDFEDELSLLLIRWDWENDGNWDTDWISNKTITHKYTSPGNYTINMEVKDTGNVISNITHMVEIYIDSDGDGYIDEIDIFPDDESEWNDTDSDGYGDNQDVFPSDPTEWIDTDYDGIGDNKDAYPNDPERWQKEDDFLPILLVILILIIILITIVILLIKRRSNKESYEKQEMSVFPSLEHISCPNCKYIFEISIEHRPFNIECPNCGTKGMIK